MNIYNIIRERIAALLAPALGVGPEAFVKITAEPPKDPSHGDVSTNAAMVLAKPCGRKSGELAAEIARILSGMEDVKSAEAAGAGFVNLRFHENFWQKMVPEILAQGGSYGNSEMGKGVSVNVEYVSANPTGPMHVGHARGAVFGDALSSLLIKAGYDVTREYYINDAGSQVETLAKSLHLRYREAWGEEIGEIPQGLYPGEYLKPAARALADVYGKKLLGLSENDWLPVVRDFAVEAMMAVIKSDLSAANIIHDKFVSEREITAQGRVDEAIRFLERKGLIYTGLLEPPKGKLPDDWEEREQLLFRSTEFGDDLDRPLRKSDGSLTYFAGDIGYHLDKISRGYSLLINVWGADHGGYVKRMQAAVAALSGGKTRMEARLCQMVNFLENGAPAKMSKRSGTFITMRDVVEKAGAGVMRFIMLTRKNDAPLDFDFARVLEQSKDNPVFYVQYAHARGRSVLRGAGETAPDAAHLAASRDGALASLLSDEAELSLIKTLSEWPRVVELAATHLEPHRIAYYLHDVANSFHMLWNKGNENRELRFITDNPRLTAARLMLVKAVTVVIASGLRVFGVEPVEEMR